ncbi:glycosyltransferase family 61 protein [Terrarubrum flagellatum]|uniref:glycosyltransferase family 61 protein n=1 Tax=Terrirubrum flagellatum TaxID=2895980 RepID=UPI003144DC6A
MRQIELIRERLKNYPGRDALHEKLRAYRKSFFQSLPSLDAATAGTVVFEEPAFSRWDGLSVSRYPGIASRIGSDRKTRMKKVMRFEGRLLLDPNARQLCKSNRMIWGSSDGVGREREPRFSSYFREPNRRLQEFASFIGAFDNNYFHFLYDTMGKLDLIERYGPDAAPLVISETLTRQRFFQDAQRMGVFGKHKLVVQTASARIGGEVAWVPSPGEPNAYDLLTLARRFGADKLPSTPGVRLYLARGPKAKNARRLRNEEELFGALVKRNFIFFDAQEHDLATQIATFARAEFIVAPHGAGLANILWRQGRPLTVVELVNPSMHTLDMAYLSVALGYDHHMVDNRGDIGQPLKSSAEADIGVVIEIVDKALRASA